MQRVKRSRRKIILMAPQKLKGVFYLENEKIGQKIKKKICYGKLYENFGKKDRFQISSLLYML